MIKVVRILPSASTICFKLFVQGKAKSASGLIYRFDPNKPLGTRRTWSMHVTDDSTYELTARIVKAKAALHLIGAEIENREIQSKNRKLLELFNLVVSGHEAKFSSPEDAWKWWDDYNETDCQFQFQSTPGRDETIELVTSRL